MIEIFARFISGYTVIIKIEENSSVSSLKNLIAQKTGLPQFEIELVYGEALLINNENLKEKEISDQDTVHVFTSQ